MMTATMLDAALDYARRGWPVFPLHSIINGRCTCEEGAGCHSPGKHPKITDWPNQATTDPATIRQWWTRWPGANIGIPTGKASRFFVLDGDPRDGGDDTLRELEAKYGALPSTVESQTGGGGFHKLFKYPGPIKSGAGVLGHGLDIRGDGGYIVAPQSLHASGRRYEWEASSHPDEVPIAATPAWLLTMLTAKSNGNGHEQRSDWLTLLRGVSKGGRYDVATRIAGHFLRIGRPVEEVETLILGYLSQCNPPGDTEEREKARRMVRDFAAKDAATGGAGKQESRDAVRSLPLTRLGDLLAEPEEVVSWLVEERLPSGGLSIMAAKPKVGKSTLARCLALAVAQGTDWLGFNTTQGTVFYLALEEKRAELRRHFEAMGATGEDPLYLFIEPSPADGLAQLRKAAEVHKPVLIIVDPLFRFVKVRDGNDYAQVTGALEPLLTLARQTGAHVLLVHHSSKKGSGDGDGILGSTAIFGSVDTALLLARRDQYRTLRSIQRYGKDLEEITLALDPLSKTISAGPSRKEADQAETEAAILEFLQGRTEPVEREMIETAVEGRTSIKRQALKLLVEQQKITRSGKGTKGDPYKFLIPHIYGNKKTRIQKTT